MRRGLISCPLNRMVKNEVARLYKPLVKNQVAITSHFYSIGLKNGIAIKFVRYPYYSVYGQFLLSKCLLL